MNGLATVLGLACLNESFRQKLLEEGGYVEARLHLLLSGVEKEVLNRMIDTPAKKDELGALLAAVEGKLRVECPTPPYCGPDQNFSQTQPI